MKIPANSPAKAPPRRGRSADRGISEDGPVGRAGSAGGTRGGLPALDAGDGFDVAEDPPALTVEDEDLIGSGVTSVTLPGAIVAEETGCHSEPGGVLSLSLLMPETRLCRLLLLFDPAVDRRQ
jgi:hypothetical protein